MKWYLVFIPIVQWLVTRDDVVIVMGMRWLDDTMMLAAQVSPRWPWLISQCEWPSECYYEWLHQLSSLMIGLVMIYLHSTFISPPRYGIGFHTFIKVHIQSRPPCTIMSEYYSYSDFPSFGDFDCGDMIQGPGETEGHVLRERGRPGSCGAEWRDMGH